MTPPWTADPPPPLRIEPQIITCNGVETRVFAIVRANGEQIATTPHADIAETMLKALSASKLRHAAAP